MNTVFERLKFARENFSTLSQEGLAEKLKVHPVSVSRWETGDRVPSIKDLGKISEAIGVSMAWFFLEPGCEIVSSEALDQKKALALIRKGLEFLEASQIQEVDEDPPGDVFSEEVGPSSPDPSAGFGRGTRKRRKAESDSSDGAGA